MSLFKIFSPSAIKNKLSKTSGKISGGISQIFTHKKLDNNLLEEFEDLLLSSDVGIEATSDFIKDLKLQKFNKEVSADEIKEFLANHIIKILLPCQSTLKIDSNLKPQVIIVNGVNGAGKTTFIGKMANTLHKNGKKVAVGACDTFRAGAVEQLAIWAKRSNCEIISALKEGEDPASVAHRAFSYAKQNNIDVLLIDTAGRLQNKQNLMDELKKINQVIKKLDSRTSQKSTPHENILVLDATTGQNSQNQLEIFDKIVNISGIVFNKLDSSAKGGILIALAKQFKKPIYAIGIGEKIEDLQEFDAKEFTKNLLEIK
jgi:fused signal recognition particle receptor